MTPRVHGLLRRKSSVQRAGPAAGGRRLNPEVIGPIAFATPSPRRTLLPLQLSLQLVAETPVGALGKDLLRRRLDHSYLVKTERVKADRIHGVVLAPLRVGQALNGAADILVWSGGEASVHDGARDAVRLEGAQTR